MKGFISRITSIEEVHSDNESSPSGGEASPSGDRVLSSGGEASSSDDDEDDGVPSGYEDMVWVVEGVPAVTAEISTNTTTAAETPAPTTNITNTRVNPTAAVEMVTPTTDTSVCGVTPTAAVELATPTTDTSVCDVTPTADVEMAAPTTDTTNTGVNPTATDEIPTAPTTDTTNTGVKPTATDEIPTAPTTGATNTGAKPTCEEKKCDTNTASRILAHFLQAVRHSEDGARDTPTVALMALLSKNVATAFNQFGTFGTSVIIIDTGLLPTNVMTAEKWAAFINKRLIESNGPNEHKEFSAVVHENLAERPQKPTVASQPVVRRGRPRANESTHLGALKKVMRYCRNQALHRLVGGSPFFVVCTPQWLSNLILSLNRTCEPLMVDPNPEHVKCLLNRSFRKNRVANIRRSALRISPDPSTSPCGIPLLNGMGQRHAVTTHPHPHSHPHPPTSTQSQKKT